jgi:hypothetical protein
MSQIDLGPETVLRLKARRVLHREEVLPGGHCVLRVFYGEHQITFEDGELAFGRGLVRDSIFQAAHACRWSDAAPRTWDDIRPLLVDLVASGILDADGVSSPRQKYTPTVLQLTSPLAGMPPLRWRTLSDLCQLTSANGHVVPIDLLEATLGAGLLAQVVRDPSGRQSGENSLAMLAPALTDPVPTEWKRCPFSGSRFEDARPMNVSALKQLAGGFDDMLARIVALREAFLATTNRERLDLGGMWLLAWICFVMPAWAARRMADRCPNGAVPEWATALSKAFGGIRMTLHFLIERGCDLDDEITPADFVRVTEEEARYLSDTGVCAGTPQMIDRTLAAFICGTGVPAPVPFPDVTSALDYGFWTAALLVLSALREARTRLLVSNAALESEAIARELADLEQREGGAMLAAQRANELAARLGLSIDLTSAPLAADMPAHPDNELLLAILGIEEQAVRIAAQYQARVNAALGFATTPPLTRRDVAAGLAPTPRRLWGDHVASQLGWTVDQDGTRLTLNSGDRHIRLATRQGVHHDQ